MYKSFIRPFLFKADPEKIHHFTFSALKFSCKIPGVRILLKSTLKIEDPKLEREVFGIKFKNPVGLGAGLDKDALVIDELACLGFGFIEIGTVTPKPQPGNEKPRLFRLKPDNALINRMGFNNSGVKAIAERLRKRKTTIIIGGNIGKNKNTLNEEALKDYEESYDELFDCVDYFVVNVSSPNTPGLRALQEKEPLKRILLALEGKNQKKNRPKPILLKIAPDLTNEQLDDIISIVLETRISGVIATNTTINRRGLHTPAASIEKIGAGGLSGKPLKNRSTEVIRYLHQHSQGRFPIIGVGGIHSEEDALEKLKAGASLIQLYTGFIYEGPGLIKRINKAILKNN
ncbi:MAG: quinone-dependent dihydroorotate dehydrogenase [Cytophagaceae bacterium]|nr:quinone-dependent dihydroorotate dehydrogenase [Cytophagaceae bacterium]